MIHILSFPPLPEAQRLRDLAGMREDIHQALKYIGAIEQQIAANWRDLVAWEGLTSAAAILYARCFTRSKARFSLPKDTLGLASTELQDTHNYLLAVRDKHIAHSENAYEHNYLVVQLALVDGRPVRVEDARVESRRLIGFSDPDIPKLRGLFEWMERHLTAMYEEERATVLEVLARVSLEQLAVHRAEPQYLFLSPDAHITTRPR